MDIRKFTPVAIANIIGEEIKDLSDLIDVIVPDGNKTLFILANLEARRSQAIGIITKAESLDTLTVIEEKALEKILYNRFN